MQFQEHEFEQLVDQLGLLAVYAHGSQVSGTARPDSDLDLALLVPRDWTGTRFDRQAEEFCFAVASTKDFPHEQIHVQDLRKCPPYFRFRVLTTGVLLGASDTTALARLQARTFSENWDEQRRMEPMLAAFRDRMRRGEFAS